jgi:hypothetical protein
MKLGAALYAVASRRRVLAIALAAGLAATVFALYRPSLLPPALHARSLHIAAASTELLVAKPHALPNNSDAYASAVNRALLVANIISSPQILDPVAHHLKIDPGAIQASAPITANVPAALITPGSSGGPTDILRLPDRYKLEIDADPTVPILWLYAQAPTAAEAIDLANLAAQGVVSYLDQTQTAAHVPLAQRATVQQLGTALGGTAATDGLPQVVLLAFGVGFVAALFLFGAGAHARRAWGVARQRVQAESSA